MDQRRLCQAVDRTLVESYGPHLAGNMNDPAAALLAHRRQHCLAGKKRGSDIHSDDLIELRSAKFAEWLMISDTRIVD